MEVRKSGYIRISSKDQNEAVVMTYLTILDGFLLRCYSVENLSDSQSEFFHLGRSL